MRNLFEKVDQTGRAIQPSFGFRYLCLHAESIKLPDSNTIQDPYLKRLGSDIRNAILALAKLPFSPSPIPAQLLCKADRSTCKGDSEAKQGTGQAGQGTEPEEIR